MNFAQHTRRRRRRRRGNLGPHPSTTTKEKENRKKKKRAREGRRTRKSVIFLLCNVVACWCSGSVCCRRIPDTTRRSLRATTTIQEDRDAMFGTTMRRPGEKELFLKKELVNRDSRVPFPPETETSKSRFPKDADSALSMQRSNADHLKRRRQGAARLYCHSAMRVNPLWWW